MESETHTLVVLCSLHAAVCLALGAVLFLPIAGRTGAAVLGALAVSALEVARRTSRAYHRRRTMLLAVKGLTAAAGDD